MKTSRLLILAALAACTLLAASAENLTVDTLRCEYLKEPIGINETHPRLSWIVKSPLRGEIQTAYQILAASTPGASGAGTELPRRGARRSNGKWVCSIRRIGRRAGSRVRKIPKEVFLH